MKHRDIVFSRGSWHSAVHSNLPSLTLKGMSSNTSTFESCKSKKPVKTAIYTDDISHLPLLHVRYNCTLVTWHE